MDQERLFEDESITHLIAECKTLAQREYKQRHDNIARIENLELCQKFDLVGEIQWYNHKPGSVVANDRVKILQDFNNCSSCTGSPRGDIKKVERLTEEIRCKEQQHRAFTKSSIAWNCKNCKTSPRDLMLLGATCSLGNATEVPTKPN